MAKILVVDDEAGIREMLHDALSIAGFEVQIALDGFDALKVLREEPADLIIADINMPRLDGFGLIERLRQGARHADRPILVLTTESSDEKKRRARDAGATGWIVKPFDAEKLATAVRRVAH